MSVAFPKLDPSFYEYSLDASFGMIGISIRLYSIYIEGIREVDKKAFAAAS